MIIRCYKNKCLKYLHLWMAQNTSTVPYPKRTTLAKVVAAPEASIMTVQCVAINTLCTDVRYPSAARR